MLGFCSVLFYVYAWNCLCFHSYGIITGHQLDNKINSFVIQKSSNRVNTLVSVAVELKCEIISDDVISTILAKIFKAVSVSECSSDVGASSEAYTYYDIGHSIQPYATY